MEHVSVHHIHVRYKGEIFTFGHHSDCISLKQLKKVINSIQNFEKGEINEEI